MTVDKKIFPTDVLCKRERVERTLNFQPVDRAALHEQVSYSPGVIALYTGRNIIGFDYTYDDICAVIRQTLDACFPPVVPLGADRVTDQDGFVIQHDNWHSMIVERPFHDLNGAREFLLCKTDEMRQHGRWGNYVYPPGVHPPKHARASRFVPELERESYRRYMLGLQARIGNTVIINHDVRVGLCECWSRLGLDTFSYLYESDPQVISDYIEACTASELCRLEAIADPSLSPVVLLADDFASKRGTIFSPAFLRKELFPRVRRMTNAWHRHGLKVLYHSDGNWKNVIPDLVECGVDGFYCLEPSLGMDIVALCKAWPKHVWAGGIDGVDLMELGTPDQVKREVHRIIEQTDVLRSGGVLIDTSGEINPPVKPANFRAMVEAVGEMYNPDFLLEAKGTMSCN